jgi:hypothetical protein
MKGSAPSKTLWGVAPYLLEDFLNPSFSGIYNMARIEPEQLPITVEGEGRPQTEFEKLRYRRPIRAEAVGDRAIERHPNPRVPILDRPVTLIDRLRYPTAQAFAPEDLEGVRQRYDYLKETRSRIQHPNVDVIYSSDKFWDTFQDVMASPDSERESYEEIKKILRIVQTRGNLFRFNIYGNVIAHLPALDRCPLDLIPVVLAFVRKYKLHTIPLRESYGAYPSGSENKTPLFNYKDKQRQEEMNRLQDEEDDQSTNSGISVEPLSISLPTREGEFKSEDDESPRSGSGLTRYPLLYSLYRTVGSRSRPHIRSNRGSGLNRSNVYVL